MRNTFIFSAIIISSLLILTSCHKVIEYIPGGMPGKGGGLGLIRIKTFVPASVTKPEIYTIHYNKAGNPVTVTGRKNESINFKYDNNDRLVEYVYYFTDTTIIDDELQTEERKSRHRYWYESNKIVKDSLSYDFVSTSGSIKFVLARRKESRLYYDSQGRIAEDRYDLAYTVQGGTEFVDGIDFYRYDSNGNLMSTNPGQSLEYDDKISYLRTHSVWMFITRNYSVNNEIGAIGYNLLGFPVGFQSSQESRQNLFEEVLWTQGARPIAITYE